MPNPGRCWRPCRSTPGRAQFLHAASHGRSNAARPYASDKQEHRPGRTRCNRNADQARGIRHRGGFLCRHLLSLPCAAGELPEGLRGCSSHVTHKLKVKSAPIRFHHLPPPRGGRSSLLTHPVSPPSPATRGKEQLVDPSGFATFKMHRPGRTRCNSNADQPRGIRHHGGFLWRTLREVVSAAGLISLTIDVQAP